MADVTNPTKTSLGASVPLLIQDIDGTNYAPAITFAGSNDAVIDVSVVTDTNIYASGDLLFDQTEIVGAARKAGGTGWITTITVWDHDNQGAAMDLIFMDDSSSLGTLNAAMAIVDSDANSAAIIGVVSIAASDYKDLGTCQYATIRNVGMQFQCASGDTGIFMGAMSKGTPTYAADSLDFKIGILRG